MAAKEIVSGLYSIRLGPANAYLIDSGGDGLTLIDCGYAKSVSQIEDAIRSIGRQPGDLTDILITHGHPDHLGSAAHFSADSAPVSLHAEDAWIARAGKIEQTMSPGPGVVNRILFRLFIGDKAAEFPSFEPQTSLVGGSNLDIGGGIEVIHTPGHTAGHVSLLWKRDRYILFAGDVAANLLGLAFSLGYDDLAAGKASLVKLAQRDFEVAVFGHGRPIMSGASTKFARRFT